MLKKAAEICIWNKQGWKKLTKKSYIIYIFAEHYWVDEDEKKIICTEGTLIQIDKPAKQTKIRKHY